MGSGHAGRSGTQRKRTFPPKSEGSITKRLRYLQVRTAQDVIPHCGMLRCTGSAVEYVLGRIETVTCELGKQTDGQRRIFMQDNDHDEIEQMKNQAIREIKSVLGELENDYPGITEGIATAIASSVGAAGSLAALYGLGVTGLSAAGITSGLATAGSFVGGGMVAGIGVLAAPIAFLGVVAYAVAKKTKNAKLATALGTAIKKLYEIQERLMQNAEYFKEEIAVINASIDHLTKKKHA